MMAPTTDPGDDPGGEPQASHGLRGIYGFALVRRISPPDTEAPPRRATATWVNQLASLDGSAVTTRITDDWPGSLTEALQRLREAEQAAESTDRARQFPADSGVDYVMYAPDRVAYIEAKRPTYERRRRGRGFHRRDALPVRMYAAVGSYLQAGLSPLKSGLSPRSLTGAAVFIAGKKRGAVAGEWRSHLSGWTGHGLAREDQLRAAWGFLWSAVRYRLRDAADLAWRPADAVLRSRTLSNLVVGIPVLAAVIAVLRHDGQYGLITNDQNIIGLGCGIYGVIRTGRWWRRVKPPKHKPGQVKE